MVGDETDPNFHSGTSTDFLYRIDLPKNNNYDRVAVVQANCNKSWYNVVAGRNTLTLDEESGTETTVTIAPGVYTKTTFATALAAGLSGGTHTYSVA